MKDTIHTIFKTGSASAIGILCGIFSTKILAIFAGPSGIGTLNILRQIIVFFQMFSTFNGNNAIVQGISSQPEKSLKICYQSTVLGIILFFTTLAIILIETFAGDIASYFFRNNSKTYIFIIRLLPAPLFFSALSYYFKALINGYREIGKLAIIDISTALTTLLLAYPIALLVQNNKNEAFVLYLAVPQLAGIILNLYFLKKLGWLEILIVSSFKPRHFLESARYFFSFSGTLLITGLVTTGVHLLTQSAISLKMGISSVGLFSVAWVFSMRYLSLVTTSFGTYYLPTLSQLRDYKSRKSLMNNIQRILIILMTPLIILAVSLKPFIIQVLYSEEFLPAIEMLRWMLIGDYIRFSGWTMGMLLLADAQLKVFFWKTIILQAFFLIAALTSVNIFSSLEYIGIGYLLMVSMNLIFLVWFVYKKYGFRIRKNIMWYWISGLVLIVTTSILYWDSTKIDMKCLPFFILALFLAYLVSEPGERMAVYRKLPLIGSHWND